MTFRKIGEERNKKKTLQVLGEIFENATTIGGKTKSKEFRTQHGIKDKYQDYFIEQVNFLTAVGYSTNSERQEHIDSCLNALPSTITSLEI